MGRGVGDRLRFTGTSGHPGASRGSDPSGILTSCSRRGEENVGGPAATPRPGPRWANGRLRRLLLPGKIYCFCLAWGAGKFQSPQASASSVSLLVSPRLSSRLSSRLSLSLLVPDRLSPPPGLLLRLLNVLGGEALVAAMSEAYFPVESGALGSEENFLSLDDILLSHEKLPVRTEIPMPRLGVFFQDRSAGAEGDHALPQGSKLELPLWLAKGLFDNKRRVLSVELPKLYQQGWRTVFSADANVVDLHKMGPHFYGFGSQLLHFDSPENVDISQSLLQTFIGRFRRIMDSSQNAYNEDTSALVARLDELERGLFQIGQRGLNDFQCWEKGQASQITASSLVQNYKKRKFADMEH